MDVVLNTYGTYLTKENDTFVVLHKDGKQRLDPEKIRSISLSKGAQISSDAALLAIQNQIDVFFVDKGGEPAGRIWSNKYGSVSTIRRNQLDFTFSKLAVQWIKETLIHKLDNQVALMLSFMPHNEILKNKQNTAIRKITDYKTKIEKADGMVVSDIASSLRGWEGAASKAYFGTIAIFLPEGYIVNGRSQHPATDIFNCLLNYGYGILYGKIEGALIKAGIDPYVGVMHRDDYNRPVLVFDVIEEFRVWIDYVVVSLCMQKVVNEDCVSIATDGAYWLEGLGKRILIQSINDYLDEVILMNGIERSRLYHIQLYANNLAQKFLKYKAS